jgi:hypothetical protein
MAQSAAGSTTGGDDATGGIVAYNRFAPTGGRDSSSTSRWYDMFGISWWQGNIHEAVNEIGDTYSDYGTRAIRLDRFTNPRVAAAQRTDSFGNVFNMVYAVAYDKYAHSLVFAMIPTWISASNTGAGKWDSHKGATYYWHTNPANTTVQDYRNRRNEGSFTIDGDYTIRTHDVGTAVGLPARTVSYYAINDVPTGSYSANDVGSHSAIAVDSAGCPVIAYYDATRGTVKIARIDGFANTGKTWQKGFALSQSDPLYNGSGTYISMAIDPSDTIHLAFYNSNRKSLVYAKGKFANVNTSGESGSFETCLVDGSLQVGPWTDISLDASGNPWIVYQDVSRSGNTEGVKIAYLAPALYQKAALDENGKTVTGWEALSVPTHYGVESARFSIEAKPSGTSVPWDGAVAYKAPDLFRLAYYQKPDAPQVRPLSP